MTAPRQGEEKWVDVDGVEVFWREAPFDGLPTLYLHGNPTDSTDWLPFLERIGGIAPDLPGWGRSAKPPDFDYSISGLDHAIEAFIDRLGVERLKMVVHDWGSIGLVFAQRFPERIERLVIINSIVGLPDYRWHYVARWFWRRRGFGEISFHLTSRNGLRLLGRFRHQAPRGVPDAWLDSVMRSVHDPGSRRATLALYRRSPEHLLASHGRDLERITAPVLVVWGDDDPFIAARHADFYGDSFPNVRVEHLSDAGHWPWLDRPELVGRICEFLTI